MLKIYYNKWRDALSICHPYRSKRKLNTLPFLLTFWGLMAACNGSPDQLQTAKTPNVLISTPVMQQQLEETQINLNTLHLRTNELQQKLRQQTDPSASLTFSLQQVESAHRTQQQLLKDWEGKLKATEQYEKAAGSTAEIVQTTQKAFQTAMHQCQQTQTAIETTLAEVKAQLPLQNTK